MRCWRSGRPSRVREPELATFELALSYDVLTNIGSLHLLIDPTTDEDSDEGCNVGQLEYTRATNGNCRLAWNTIFEPPGLHALQSCLVLKEGWQPKEVEGPICRFVVSNLCQFSLSSAYLDPDKGATLHAQLLETNATYSVQIKVPGGNLVKTIEGSTTNGILKVFWDLTDDQGRLCTNNT